jgi:hypothetical protein
MSATSLARLARLALLDEPRVFDGARRVEDHLDTVATRVLA